MISVWRVEETFASSDARFVCTRPVDQLEAIRGILSMAFVFQATSTLLYELVFIEQLATNMTEIHQKGEDARKLPRTATSMEDMIRVVVVDRPVPSPK